MSGRGAWSDRGQPGPGRAYRRGSGITVAKQEGPLDFEAVRHGVSAIQMALGWHGLKVVVDGKYGDETIKAVTTLQNLRLSDVRKYVHFKDDYRSAPGETNMDTAYALFTPIIDSYAFDLLVPRNLLRALLTLESALDPGAVGFVSDKDHGIAQFNTSVYDTFDPFDPFQAIKKAGQMMAERKKDPAYADNWIYVIAAHNAPSWAQAWANGTATPDQQKHCEGYVSNVLGRAI